MRVLLIVATAIVLMGCSGSSTLGGISPLGKKVKKEYFANGQLRSEFIMTDSTGMNGIKKTYGLDGKLISVSPIRKGVRHGVEKWYDKNGRLLMTIPYVNGRKHGVQVIYYENGDPLIKQRFVRGAKNGETIVYKKDGSVAKRMLFKNDKRIS